MSSFKKTTSEFVIIVVYIIVVYVDDLNIIGAHKEILDALVYLKEQFEIKDLRKIKLCISLQIKHLPHGILVH